MTRNYTKHNETGARLYRIWAGMLSRCNNPNNKTYRYYGKKGIKVCSDWNNYLKFKEWSVNNGYQDNLVIDRINSLEDYRPENCQWITQTENLKKANHNNKFNYKLEFMESEVLDDIKQEMNLSDDDFEIIKVFLC